MKWKTTRDAVSRNTFFIRLDKWWFKVITFCSNFLFHIYVEPVTRILFSTKILIIYFPADNPQSSYKNESRAFTSCYWFLIITVLNIYSGNLVAFSTMRKLKLPVNSIEELAAKSEYQAGVSRGGSTASLFRVCAFINYLIQILQCR